MIVSDLGSIVTEEEEQDWVEKEGVFLIQVTVPAAQLVSIHTNKQSKRIQEEVSARRKVGCVFMSCVGPGLTEC